MASSGGSKPLVGKPRVESTLFMFLDDPIKCASSSVGAQITCRLTLISGASRKSDG